MRLTYADYTLEYAIFSVWLSNYSKSQEPSLGIEMTHLGDYDELEHL